MKILLIEDEKLVAQELVSLLAKLEPEAEILAILDSVIAGKSWLAENPAPDLILSDIQLSDGVSFEIFEKHQPQCPLIFTTAYDEYAIRAFKLNSLDYLLKPIRESELSHALEQFHKYTAHSEAQIGEQFNSFLQDLKKGKKFKSRFTAHHGQSIISVPDQQVGAFEKDELIFLRTIDGAKLITDYHTLDELEELLDPERYYRANRQFIVHLDAISDYKAHYSGKLFLHLAGHPKSEIIVSREKAAGFKRWFEG